MSDFLSKLASRTMGIAPLVEPCIIPMFAAEPLASTTATYDEFLEIAQDAQEPTSHTIRAGLPELLPVGEERAGSPGQSLQQDPPQPTAQVVAANVLHKASVASEPPVSTPLTPAPRPQPTRPAESVEAPRAAQQKVVRRLLNTSPLLITEAASPSRSSPLQAVANKPEALSIEDERPAAPPARSSPPAPAPSLKDRTDEALLLPYEPAATLAAHQASPAADRGGPLVAATAVELTMPPRRNEDRPAAATAALPAAPTIEITIGRVEVRAVHPPAPAPRPKTPGPLAPSLALEAYLRNQNGGKR